MRDTSPIDALKEYLDRWAAAHLSCEPADRRTAEEGVRDAYASAGLAPPQRIVWCGGPLEIAQHLAAASADDLIGANVKAEIFDQVRNRVGTFAEVFWKEVRGRSNASWPTTNRSARRSTTTTGARL